MKATILDVAQLARVSKDTASVVLNGSRSNTRVGAATRVRVEEAARTLGYQPNAVARGLSRQKMDTIGVLIGAVPLKMSSFENSYAATLLDGILAAARRERYNVTLFAWTWEEVREGLATFQDRRNDGFILIAPPTDEQSVRIIAEIGVPVVTVAHFALNSKATSIVAANQQGVLDSVTHLVTLGHTRIACIAGPPDIFDSQQRQAGFVAAMEQHGLALRPEYQERGSFGGPPDEAAAERLLSLPEPPTAIVCANDTSALSVYHVAIRRGLSIPEQLSVIGFDDIPLAVHASPALTTVTQPLQAMGEAAADSLFAHFQAAPSSFLLKEPAFPTTLVVRSSTGPAPA
jgi:LacI family transcriptional regulator